MGALVTTAIILGGLLMTAVEPEAIGNSDSLSGIWWAAVTTVGTGINEPGPETLEGRAIALVLMLCGVALLTTLAGSIAAFFLGNASTEETTRMNRQLDEIHRGLVRSGDIDPPPPQD